MYIKLMFKSKKYFLYFIPIVGILLYSLIGTKSASDDHPLIEKATLKSFQVAVHTVGELDAAKSKVISSSIRGDLGKIIYLIPDGSTVNPGDILVRMDPTPFEEKIRDQEQVIKEQISLVESGKKVLDWEIKQAELEQRTNASEVESAQMELNKVVNGDGPLELSRLKSAMQKAEVEYDALKFYAEDLVSLEKEGFLNPSEVQQTQKKQKESEEAYLYAKMQYEAYNDFVFPILVKKTESQLKRSQIKQEESLKSGEYKIACAKLNLQQGELQYRDAKQLLKNLKDELALTEIRAQAPGMVVLREDWRSGSRRKPLVGDVVLKNQPLIDVPDLGSMIVKTRVREVDLHKVQKGKEAIVEVDAYPELQFKGKVSTIGVLALSDPKYGDEKNFFVEIALGNSDGRLRPGMTARVTILCGKVDQKVSIPFHAVFDLDKRSVLYVKDRGMYDCREVKLGLSNDQWIEVLSGLEEGEEVCLMKPHPSEIKKSL